MRSHHLCIVVLFAFGCGGETLAVGYDDGRLPRDPAEPVDLVVAGKRCAAPPTAIEPSRDLSPNEVIAAGKQLLRGRWFRCPETTDRYPPAIEIAADGAFALVNRDGVFARDTPVPFGVVGFAVRADAFVVRYRDRDFAVTFQRNPMRMRWVPLDGRDAAGVFVAN